MSVPLARGRALLALVAGLSWLGLALQLGISMRLAAAHGQAPLRGALDALCYFTVLTNLLVAVVATLALAQVRTALTARATLAAVGTYIFVVGLIYTLLLRALWAPTGLHKIADALLHDVVPVAYLLWWTGFAPRGGLGWSQPLRWLGYPLAYFVFSLVLGAATGRYRYPFADVATLGLPAVARNGALLLALFLALGFSAVALDRVLSRRAAAARPPA